MKEITPQEAMQLAADHGDWNFRLSQYLRRTLGEAAAAGMLEWDKGARKASNL